MTESLRRALARKANQLFLGGTTSQGILDDPAITVGGTIGTDLDEVVDAVTGIQQAGGTPSGIIASPDAWGYVSKLKDEATSNRSLVGAGTESATRSLLSIPVTVSPDAPAGALAIIDNRAIVADIGDVRLAEARTRSSALT